ncbi:MAG: hypothetical protein J0M08_12050 [Bacteroidetes bacterium]|nr:hypothetical protein [Bacteroidota bacterium]
MIDNQKLWYDLVNSGMDPDDAQAFRYKKVDYEYDLISGKVNTIAYQQGKADRFYHHYEYDADNRITEVYSSTYPNAVWRNLQADPTWNLDAKYFYYKHGPLARVEYGENQVQGQDFVYTLQGWIKGVNSNTLDKTRDIGNDGNHSTQFTLQNATFAQDAFGYSLNYFDGDYSAIDTSRWNTITKRFEADKTGSNWMAERHDLFNGNISAMATTLMQPVTPTYNAVYSPTVLPLGNAYKYDQLNRIIQSRSFNDLTSVSNSWGSGGLYEGTYQQLFTYDANGNMLTATVNNDAGFAIDNQDYRYQTVGGVRLNNRLYAINDSATSTGGFDLTDQIAFDNSASTINSNNNYSYSEIGELKKDVWDSISNIVRRADGKILSITRTTGCTRPNIKYDYDPMGKRIAKHTFDNSNAWIQSEYYIKDATGNTMSTYVYKDGSFAKTEDHLYGSSSLGIVQDSLEMIGAYVDTVYFSHVLGKKQYSGSNHLGNVLSTFSDIKIPLDQNNNDTIDSYVADISSSKDYGAFGEYLTNRNFNRNEYPNSFNGKRDDNELFGWQDYGSRNYLKSRRTYDVIDARHRKNSNESPYIFVSNNPICHIDVNGEEKIVVSGSEHPGRYGLNFVLPAMKQLHNIQKNNSKNERVAWLVFEKGYSTKQLIQMNRWAERNGVAMITVKSADEVVNYINSGIKEGPNFSSIRKEDPITQVNMFSHGVPGNISFGYGNSDVEQKYSFTEAQAKKLNPNAFETNASCTIFACRIGAGKSVNDFTFDTDPEKSLAQAIADQTGMSVNAWQSRTEYSGILNASYLDDLTGKSTNRSVTGDSWFQNIEQIELPTTGTTPWMSPGQTEYKKNETPKVK